MIKGSALAILAGQKAKATRERNKALKQKALQPFVPTFVEKDVAEKGIVEKSKFSYERNIVPKINKLKAKRELAAKGRKVSPYMAKKYGSGIFAQNRERIEKFVKKCGELPTKPAINVEKLDLQELKDNECFRFLTDGPTEIRYSKKYRSLLITPHTIQLQSKS